MLYGCLLVYLSPETLALGPRYRLNMSPPKSSSGQCDGIKRWALEIQLTHRGSFLMNRIKGIIREV